MQQTMGQDQIGQPQAQQQMVQMSPQVQMAPQVQMSQQVQMAPQVQMNQQVQMMYSPVRFVYDPGMMMQQEQIQQQQNMFVNQPPWARPVQNQVIYVQQIGQHLVPIQQIDPNIYIQQNPYTGVPQMVQNIQNLPQSQIRPIMGSLPHNMVQNFVPNMQGIPNEQPMGQIMTNYGIIQANQEVNVVNNVANTSNEENRQVVSQNTAQNTPNHEVPTQVYRPMIQQMSQQQTVIRPQMQIINQLQNMANFQNMGQQIGLVSHMAQNIAQISQNVPGNTQVSQNDGGNVGQIGQNVGNVTQMQRQNIVGNVSINVGQNVAQTVPNAGANMTQTMIGNVRPNIAVNQPTHANHLPNTNIRPSSVASPQPPQNIATNTTIIRPSIEANVQMNTGQIMSQMRHITQPQNINITPRTVPQSFANNTTVDRSTNTVLYSAVRNGQPYTYRAIQPKPNANVRMNYAPRGNQIQMIRKALSTNANNVNSNNKVDNSTSMNLPPVRSTPGYVPPVAIKTETDNSTYNRKRKSESPDEVQKKVANFGSITVTEQVKDRIKARYRPVTSDIGVNTSPARKIEPKVEKQQPMLQINPMETSIKKESVEKTETGGLSTNVSTDNSKPLQETTNDVKMKKEQKDMGQQTERQPYVRKTVFPQAKGRLLENKSNSKPDMPSLEAISKNVQSSQNIPGPLPQNVVLPPPQNPLPLIQNLAQTNNNISIVSKTDNLDKLINKPPVNVNSNNPSTSAVLAEIKNLEEIKAKMTAEQNKATVDKKESVANITLENKDSCKSQEQNNTTVSSKEKNDIGETLTANDKSENRVENTNLIETREENPLTTSKEDEKMDTDESISKPPTDFDEIIKDTKIDKKEYKNISISDIAGKEIHIIDGNITKKERDFVLTHVLDGYVIQESNVPFAIRKPLKEKTINSVIDDKQESLRNLPREEPKDKLPELSQLHLEETTETDAKENVIENKDEEVENKTESIVDDSSESSTGIVVEKENPFRELRHSIVKSWTVDELTNQLAKHNWTETVSLFQEHEIDGESLLLVTKSQLVTIGVCEEHAEIISEFLQKN